MRSKLKSEERKLGLAARQLNLNWKTFEWVENVAYAARKCIMRNGLGYRGGATKELFDKCQTSVEKYTNRLGKRPSSTSPPPKKPTFRQHGGGENAMLDIVEGIVGRDPILLVERIFDLVEDVQYARFSLQVEMITAIEKHQSKPSESGRASPTKSRDAPPTVPTDDHDLVVSIVKLANEYDMDTTAEKHLRTANFDYITNSYILTRTRHQAIARRS
jgi:hypothetical protein